jgi:hypothetical protein
MSSSVQPSTEELSAAPGVDRWSPADGDGRTGRLRRRGRLALVIVVILALVGTGTGVGIAVGSGSSTHSSAPSNAAPTTTSVISQHNLSSQINQSGTLTYASSWSVVNQANGTITQLPSVGAVINQGQPLYDVDGSPVVLLYGATPVYRGLQAGVSDGPDVAQLNWDLVALGYESSTDASSIAHFSSATASALDQLQASLGIAQTGALPLGQAVFLPGAARVASVSATLGSAAAPKSPVLTATSTTRVVTVNLDATQQSLVKAGDQVQITLPNNQSTPGTVLSVGTVATSNNSSPATVSVTVAPTDAAATGTLDQAPVQVAITTGTVDNALVVPVNALLALASGGYGLETVDRDGRRRLVQATPGLFDDADGLVAVTGAGLVPGMRVVVPSE